MLALDMSRILAATNPHIKKAGRLFQLGHLQFALDDLERAAVSHEDLQLYDLLKGHIQTLLRKSDETVSLVWRLDANCWESAWLRYLLQGLFDDEVTNVSEIISNRCLIVVDNLLTEEKSNWYRELYLKGFRICLFHLSDEGFVDDVINVYRWCSLVYRNLWSPLLNACGAIKAFPLGIKAGFEMDKPPVLASARRSLWGFAGDIKKSTRRQMVDEMNKVGQGSIHLTSGFASVDALDVQKYQAFLSDCTFGPCPSGFVNLDSFRVYECLEAGTIPIVERRDGFEYFTALLGSHPMPTVSGWQEAPHEIRSILHAGAVDRLQLECVEWWRSVKADLKLQISADITGYLNLNRS